MVAEVDAIEEPLCRANPDEEAVRTHAAKMLSEKVCRVESLGAHASTRQMWRIHTESSSAVVVYQDKPEENRAFVGFARHFRAQGISVPHVLAVSDCECWYIVQDLGDTTLYSLLQECRTEGNPFPREVLHWYERALRVLPHIQVSASTTLDFNLCYPHKIFDEKGMMCDLAAFRKDFLERMGVVYDVGAIQTSFEEFVHWLGTAGAEHFVYRDFQARNIMVHEDDVWFIDFQGGRKGPLQYDVVSLLFQARARFTEEVRATLRNVYLDELETLIPVDRVLFKQYFDGFALLRVLQVLSVYGREGVGNGKEYFKKGIPHAIRQVLQLLDTESLKDRMAGLRSLKDQLLAVCNTEESS